MLKKSLPLTGTGDETRDFTYVLDLVEGLIKAGFYENAICQAFNLASGKEFTIKDFNQLVKNDEFVKLAYLENVNDENLFTLDSMKLIYSLCYSFRAINI